MPTKEKARGRYAYGTEVPVEASQQEIARVLKRHGATQHGFAETEVGGVVFFSARGRQVRFQIPYPKNDPLGRDSEVRRRWRCLLISVKAKFEAVSVAGDLGSEDADAAFRVEFLAHTVLPDGTTVAQKTLPLVARAYDTGQVPRLLLSGLEPEEEP